MHSTPEKLHSDVRVSLFVKIPGKLTASLVMLFYFTRLKEKSPEQAPDNC